MKRIGEFSWFDNCFAGIISCSKDSKKWFKSILGFLHLFTSDSGAFTVVQLLRGNLPDGTDENVVTNINRCSSCYRHELSSQTINSGHHNKPLATPMKAAGDQPT